MKAIYTDGIWIVTAIVGGNVQEFAGRYLHQAVRLLELAKTEAMQ